jgi:hypothetical protein
MRDNARPSEQPSPACQHVQFRDVAEYRERFGSSVTFLGRRLNTYRQNVYGLLDPLRHRLVLTDDLVQKVAELIGREPEYVRVHYAALMLHRLRGLGKSVAKVDASKHAKGSKSTDAAAPVVVVR